MANLLKNWNTPLTRNLWLAGVLGGITGYLSLWPEVSIAGRGDAGEATLKRMDLERRYVYTPFLWALVSSGLVWGLHQWAPKEWQSYWIVGLLLSILVPTFKAIGNYAQTVYGVSTAQLYATDILVYTLFWGIAMQFLAKQIEKGATGRGL